MRAPLFAPHPGRHRRTRVVNVGPETRRRHFPIDEETLGAWRVGLNTAELFQRFFPLEFAACVADRPTTIPELCCVAEAFLGMVNQRLFALDEWGEVDIPIDPMTHLERVDRYDLDHATYLLGDASWPFEQPHPCFYGLGVQSVLNDYMDADPADQEWEVLTLGLWQLFSSTAWAIGYDIADLSEHLPKAHRQALNRLRPLPELSNDGVHLLLDTFTLDRPYGGPGGNLIRYAFGRTGNDLANMTTVEVGDLFDTYETSWNDTFDLVEASREAVKLFTSYSAWERAVMIDPLRELTLLNDQLLRLVDVLKNPPPPKTLAEIFMADEAINDNTIDLSPAPAAEVAYP